jgi:hypothetical protein
MIWEAGGSPGSIPWFWSWDRLLSRLEASLLITVPCWPLRMESPWISWKTYTPPTTISTKTREKDPRSTMFG